MIPACVAQFWSIVVCALNCYEEIHLNYLVSTGIFERSCLEPPSGVVEATALVRVEAGAEV
jgi:hypothetical protein